MENERGNVGGEGAERNLRWQKMCSLWGKTILSCVSCKCKSPLGHKESLQLGVKVSEENLNIISAIYLATWGIVTEFNKKLDCQILSP